MRWKQILVSLDREWEYAVQQYEEAKHANLTESTNELILESLSSCYRFEMRSSYNQMKLMFSFVEWYWTINVLIYWGSQEMKERAEYTRTREILSRPSLARGQTQTSTIFRARHNPPKDCSPPGLECFFFLFMQGQRCWILVDRTSKCIKWIKTK